MLNLSNRSGMILFAGVIYLLSILIMARFVSLGLFDILITALVIVALILLAYTSFATISEGLARTLDFVQTIIAAIVALRFLVMFIGDLEAFSTILLYGSVIAFLFVALTGVWSLVSQKRGSRPGADMAPRSD